jgi:3-hydroxybutyryl-CoA dehydrogenase
VSELGRVGVVGAGFMGTGIAESVARAGATVRLVEPEELPRQRSRQRLRDSVARAVAAGKLPEADANALEERVSWHGELRELEGCELVIEAATEDLALKSELFNRLDAALPDAVLASNTSSIPIARLAAATTRPHRVLGLHFFSPVPVMRLVELVVALQTDDATVAYAERFARAVGKTPIRSKDRAGFLVNFLLVPYLFSAIRMLEEGFAEAEAIDEGMRLGCGHPMGPLQLADFIGLDVLEAIGDSLLAEFSRPEYAPPPLLRRMVSAGRLGRKSGRGFHPYDGSA